MSFKLLLKISSRLIRRLALRFFRLCFRPISGFKPCQSRKNDRNSRHMVALIYSWHILPQFHWEEENQHPTRVMSALCVAIIFALPSTSRHNKTRISPTVTANSKEITQGNIRFLCKWMLLQRDEEILEREVRLLKNNERFKFIYSYSLVRMKSLFWKRRQEN